MKAASQRSSTSAPWVGAPEDPASVQTNTAGGIWVSVRGKGEEGLVFPGQHSADSPSYSQSGTVPISRQSLAHRAHTLCVQWVFMLSVTAKDIISLPFVGASVWISHPWCNLWTSLFASHETVLKILKPLFLLFRKQATMWCNSHTVNTQNKTN